MAAFYKSNEDQYRILAMLNVALSEEDYLYLQPFVGVVLAGVWVEVWVEVANHQ